jgi:rhodanese-related sulfurtransferase
MKSREDLLKAAREEIREMSVGEVKDYVESGNTPVLVDIRGLDEWERGHLDGAIHIPRGRLEAEVEEKVPDKSRETIVYCAGGVRSLLGAISMKELGYENLISMDGGFGDWEDAHYPVVQPPPPAEDEGPVDVERLTEEIAHLEAMIAQKKAKLPVNG